MQHVQDYINELERLLRMWGGCNVCKHHTKNYKCDIGGHCNGYQWEIGQVEYCEQCAKICYSKRDACIAIKTAKHNRKNYIPIRYYFCDYCGAYHVTSQKHRRDKAKWAEVKKDR